ncbi:hypothetical protein OGAPHI_000912 [Ogataea philodendri]|uniref:PXA domain-containing protein n=1 Tax=Ogataea philodendri TaxID=1378263 RepID=A0A9P8PE94_9ASCO|nr:uncharacterized protein OGAPHI_000912 [Ogataea philodendri]KAH3670397.1 hypothetical protein OGAPHI_000912 [Ogataea philodendri]
MASRIKYLRRRTDNTSSKSPVNQPPKDSPEYINSLVSQLFGPNHDSLPALTSSPNLDPELYALLGLILRQFVTGWYKNVSFDENEEFMNEIIALTAHMTRDIQQRCLRVNWGQLFFDDLFILLDRHLQALRETQIRSGTKYSRDDTNETLANYLILNGHFAVQIDDPQLESQYRLVLSKKMLQLLLPSEELHSKLSMMFVETIFSDLLLKNIVENLSDNFMLWNLTRSISESVAKHPSENRPLFEKLIGLSRRLGHIIAYCTSVFSIKVVPETSIIQYAVFPFSDHLVHFSERHPILSFQIASAFHILDKSAKFNHLCNNVLNNLIYNRVLTDSVLGRCVRGLRHMLFPTDGPFNTAPRYVPETRQELDQIKLAAQTALNKVVSHPYLDTSSFVDSFEYKLINKSLIWSVLDLVLCNIFPELTQSTEQDE